MSPTPEQLARQAIDRALVESGWIVQDRAQMNLTAGRGVAVLEFKMASGHGFADYLLFVDEKAVGALEAKPAGYRLFNVEIQADKYARGLPAGLTRTPPTSPPQIFSPAPAPSASVTRHRSAIKGGPKPRSRGPAAHPFPTAAGLQRS